MLYLEARLSRKPFGFLLFFYPKFRTEYFILELNICKVENVGWRLVQHLDVLRLTKLLDAIDPIPFSNYTMREEQDCSTSRGCLTLSGDEWEHERPTGNRQRKSPPSGSGWSRGEKNVTIRARRDPSGKSLRRSDKEVPL